MRRITALYSGIRRPRWINVELTSRCNLRCPLCPTGNGLASLRKGMIDPVSLAEFMKHAAPWLSRIDFLGNGEPLLHPKAAVCIEAATSLGIATALGSNGNAPFSAEELVESGLGELHLDIDGATQEMHEQYRRGGSLQRTLDFMSAVRDARERRKLSSPALYVLTLISAKNREQLPAIARLAWAAGADAMKTQYIADAFSLKVESERAFSTWFSPDHPQVRMAIPKPCLWQNSLGMLTWDGNLMLCPMHLAHAGQPAFLKGRVFSGADIPALLSSASFNKATLACGSHAFCAGCQCASYEQQARIRYFSLQALGSEILRKARTSPLSVRSWPSLRKVFPSLSISWKHR